MADRGYFTRKLGGDKVFSVEAPKIKFGNGVLNELGEDAKSLGMRRVAVFTDRIVAEQESLEIVVKSLEKAGMECEIYNEVEVEPLSLIHI